MLAQRNTLEELARDKFGILSDYDSNIKDEPTAMPAAPGTPDTHEPMRQILDG